MSNPEETPDQGIHQLAVACIYMKAMIDLSIVEIFNDIINTTNCVHVW